MKKIFKTVAALAVVMFAGCTNDLTNEVVAPVVGETTVVGVGFDQTKTYLGDLVDGARKVYWSENDQIAINGNASTAIAIAEGNRYAEFTFNGILSYPYSVLYPASAYVDASTINLPAVQEAADGTFATNCAPMACVAGEGDALALHHLASVVRLQATLPAESTHAAHKLAKVEFRGKAGEQVSGNFTINYAEATLAATSEAEADKVVTTKVDKALSTEATDIFVVVPAGEYAEGFTVRLIDEAGHYMDIATNAITLKKGDVKAMPAFNFVPTGTLVGVQISSAEAWNTFVAAYNKGDYANVENLTVNITADLVFDETTNKAFNLINEFSGTLDGGNNTIKNLTAIYPLFNEIASTATVKNLTIDSSCSFTPEVKWYYAGTFARQNKGNLVNCVNRATLHIQAGEWNHHVYIGGLSGENTQLIDNCFNYGAITFEEGVNIASKYLRVGGLTGFNNGASSAISNSNNHGVITLAGSNGTSQNNFIGGIAGESSGSIDGCINNGAIKGNFAAKYHYVGGIVGIVTKNNATANVTNNTNNGDLTGYSPAPLVTQTETDNGIEEKTTETERIFVGGIAALAENLAAKFESNTNNASVTVDKGTNYVYVGGCLGWLPGAVTGSFKNNSVTKNVVVTCTSNSAITGVGGLVGSLANNAVIDLNGDTGVIACTVIGGSAKDSDSKLGIGGVVGYSLGGLTIKNVTNWSGTINVDWNLIGGELYHNVGVGAICGLSTGSVTIEGCTSGGTITLSNIPTSANNTFKNRYVIGGVMGLCIGNNTYSINNCTNKVAFSYSGSAKYHNFMPMLFGGIVGLCSEGNTTITNCTNEAVISNLHYNRANEKRFNDLQYALNYTAGIIAGYGFNVGYNANNKHGELTTNGILTITGCHSTKDITAKSGSVGGIAGLVRNATISNCDFTGTLTSMSTIGGIVGNATNSTISSCTVRCTTKQSSTSGSNASNVGGIAGYLHSTCVIDNCASFSTISNQAGRSGGISGYTSNDSTIKNCKFGGSVKDVAISSDNYADYVANVLNGWNADDDTAPTIENNNSYWDGK